MAKKLRPHVSVSAGFYDRLVAWCDDRGVSMARVVSTATDSALRGLEMDADARAKFIAEMKAQHPDGGGRVDFSVKGPTAARLGALRRRTGMTNNQLINAMLDKAGAP